MELTLARSRNTRNLVTAELTLARSRNTRNLVTAELTLARSRNTRNLVTAELTLARSRNTRNLVTAELTLARSARDDQLPRIYRPSCKGVNTRYVTRPQFGTMAPIDQPPLWDSWTTDTLPTITQWLQIGHGPWFSRHG
ncbi:hypothetical protein J6590_029429 [Homalodisca vitripennis]|nr:hypothetical protein J6590_029429 [Homalodisca vitripennis]